MSAMRFQAKHVSTSDSGDYFQALFEAVEDASDHDSPYLLIQRQFEDPDGGQCYIETHDENYIGHFRVHRIEFSSSRIVIEIDRPRDNLVEVALAMTAHDFEQAARVVDIIAGAKAAP